MSEKFGLTILGSAAAEGMPARFCTCELCTKIRKMKPDSKDYRYRCSYALGDAVRIDFGPDSYASELRFGIDSGKMRHLLLTHSHEDHFFQTELEFRRKGFSIVDKTLTIHASQFTLSTIPREILDKLADHQIELHEIRPFVPFTIPEEKLRIIPLTATHQLTYHLPGIALLFIIERGDQRLFIGNDTGVFPPETQEFLDSYPDPFDVIVLDCTMGPNRNGTGHLGARPFVDTILGMKGKPGCRRVANHFTHNALTSHAEFEAWLNPLGIEVGYDGMEL